MGFFGDLLDRVTPTFTNAIAKAANKATKQLLWGDVGSTGSINSDDYEQVNVYKTKKYAGSNYTGVFSNPQENKGEFKYEPTKPLTDEERKKLLAKPIKGQSLTDTALSNMDMHIPSKNDNAWQSTSENIYNPISSLAIPRWGIKDFINERVSWQKSLDSLTGEPGWFYFKVFFKFDTNFGLFGGILGDNDTSYASNNTASNYLLTASGTYSNDGQRLISANAALHHFTRLLSYISSKAPWFFDKVTGMEELDQFDYNDLTKDKFINISCMQDAVDMRLTTLMDMYKHAVYDVVNNKELIPENLRKFDMSVVVFHTPLRYYQTGGKSLTQGNYPYKNMYADNFGDRMSFKMVTFKDCEFVLDSMNVLPGEMSNETAFGIGKNVMKVKYNKAYTTELNEWFHTMVSDIGGVMWGGVKDGNYGEKQKKRIKALQYALDHAYYRNDKSITYKAIIDASEDIITDAMRMIKPEDAFGNLYGQMPS